MTSQVQIAPLGQALWAWNICEGCQRAYQCRATDCPSERGAQLRRYVQFVNEQVSSYASQGGTRPPRSQDHIEFLYRIIAIIKSQPDITRQHLRQELSGSDSDGQLEGAIGSAIAIMSMMDCSPWHRFFDSEERGLLHFAWSDATPFSQYIQESFPYGSHPALSHPETERYLELKAKLKATRLKKHLNLTFRATDDLKDHLRLNRRRKILYIYHHTGFLKEQLRLTKDIRQPTIAECIRRGALPRQLALEVMDSLQGILFPLADRKTQPLLRALVEDLSLDPDILEFDFVSNRNEWEKEVPYLLLAGQLSDLERELEAPAPQGWLQEELERRKGPRYMMLATLVGVFFAVFLGIISVAITGYQTWLTYQAWQHPVPPSSGT